MRVIFKNRTQYREDDLRAIVIGACKAAGVGAQVLTVFVSSARRGRVSGWAYFPAHRTQRSNSMKIRIPAVHETTVEKVAQVMLHEAMHLRGARHADMTEEQLRCCMPVPWATGLLLRLKDAPVVACAGKKASRAERLEHAQRMLARARTRLKRASTIESKWSRRVKLLSRPSPRSVAP